jgi:hypothetical protein
MMFFRVPAVLRRLLTYSDSGAGHISANRSKQVRFADESVRASDFSVLAELTEHECTEYYTHIHYYVCA